MYRRQTGSNSVTSCLSVIQAQSQRVTRRNTPRFADYAAELNLATFPLPETAEKGKPVYNARYLVDENARSELEALFAMMKRNAIRLFLAATAAVLAFAFHARGGGQTTTPDSRSPQPPGSLRLYVMDCGTLHIADMERFQLKKEEVSTTNLSVACFLVVHPKGTLLWDAGAVPDATWKPTGSPTTQHVVLPDSQERDVTVLCAGEKGGFSLEDAVCAGLLADGIERAEAGARLSDAAQAARALGTLYGTRLDRLRHDSGWARHLEARRRGPDLDCCLRLDASGLVPVLVGGAITSGPGALTCPAAEADTRSGGPAGPGANR